MRNICLVGMLAIVGISLISSPAGSVAVFQPTNQSVNIINTDCLFNNNCTAAILRIFDDNATAFVGSHLALNPNRDEAHFSPVIGQNIGYLLSNYFGLSPSNVVDLLTGNDHFLIALSLDGTGNSWPAPTEPVACNDANTTCTLTWAVGPTVIAVDLVQALPPGAV